MVEADVLQPGDFFVALVALGALFSFVDIVLFMAAVAVGIDFLGFGAEDVAGLAGQAIVRPVEREIGV